MNRPSQASIQSAFRGLDRWFDSIRVDWPTAGYGGPVVHWWGHSLVFRGAGLDWRYESIVDGYLTLHRATGDPTWLEKAIRAGWDLVEGQLPNGHFMNSGFERNPETGGTPHEAAADIALLLLARELRETQPVVSQRYIDAARLNLHGFWIGKLWHSLSSTLWDRPGVPSFVPNKAATFVEAILPLAEVSGDEQLVERYAIPSADHIIGMQVARTGHLLDGAIAQNWFHEQKVDAYFPLYIARCIPPLLQLAERTGDRRYPDAAAAATQFLLRVRDRDGAFPQVLYCGGRQNRYPRWIAGVGDIVRALQAPQRVDERADPLPTVGWMLRGVRPDGHIASADGFGKIVPFLSRRDRFADEVGVVGWCDKSFRVLAAMIEPRVHSNAVHHPQLATVEGAS